MSGISRRTIFYRKRRLSPTEAHARGLPFPHHRLPPPLTLPSKVSSRTLFIRAGERYRFEFGYNADDGISASKVLEDGYGQCNTKGTLFMALLRACEIPCRIHGFTIDKRLQKGAMSGFVYKKAPQNILHSWVEVFFENKWYELEAFILDQRYLSKLQEKFAGCTGFFCGYGVAVKDFRHPIIDFDRNNTYIPTQIGRASCRERV